MERGWRGAGGGWKAEDNYGSAFVFTSGNSRTLGKIDCQSRLPRGTLITYKFMKEELFAVLTCTLCIYNIMFGLGREAAQWCD